MTTTTIPRGAATMSPGTAIGNVLADSLTMFRRDVRHLVRYPVMTISSVVFPTFILLLFVHVLGGSVGSATGGGSYIGYVLPGILVMSIGGGAAGTAINVCTDMNAGIITRFRTMDISRTALLAGQAIGGVLRSSVGVALVIGVALLLGFRPTAGVGEWLAAVAVLLALMVAATWLAIAIGLAAKTEGGANSGAQLMVFLPFVSSAFVPTDTMSSGWAWFAEHQPFTAFIDTLRALLADDTVGATATVGGSAWVAIAWGVALTVIGFAGAVAAFRRTATRR